MSNLLAIVEQSQLVVLYVFIAIFAVVAVAALVVGLVLLRRSGLAQSSVKGESSARVDTKEPTETPRN